MSNIIPRLNLNRHPKNCDNYSLIDAKNIILTEDGTIQNDVGITYNSVIHNYIKVKYGIKYEIIWCLPCNTEIILFIKLTNKDDLIVIRYDENINTCVTITDNFKYFGGTLTGTFTYNVDNNLIVAISEYGTDNNVPLRIINFGRIKENENGYYNYLRDGDENQLNNYELQYINPVVILPDIDISLYYNKWYKGQNYIFIRYKIDSVQYTKWYDTHVNIYSDTYINKKFNNNIDSSAISNCSIGDEIIDSAPKIIIRNNKNNDNFKYFQLCVVIINKTNTICRKTDDINIDTNIFNFNLVNTENYELINITTNNININNCKNIINYNNKLFISNYIENNNNIDLKEFVTNNVKYKFVKEDFNYTNEVVQSINYTILNVDNVDKYVPISFNNTNYIIENFTDQSDNSGYYADLPFAIFNTYDENKELTNNLDSIFNFNSEVELINQFPISNDKLISLYPKYIWGNKDYSSQIAHDLIVISDLHEVIKTEDNSNPYVEGDEYRVYQCVWDKDYLYENIILYNKTTNTKNIRNETIILTPYTIDGYRIPDKFLYPIDIRIPHDQRGWIGYENNKYFYNPERQIKFDYYVDESLGTVFMIHAYKLSYINKYINVDDIRVYNDYSFSLNNKTNKFFLKDCYYNLFIHYVDKYNNITNGIPFINKYKSYSIEYKDVSYRYGDKLIGIPFIETNYHIIYMYFDKNSIIEDLYNTVYVNKEKDYNDNNTVPYILKIINKNEEGWEQGVKYDNNGNIIDDIGEWIEFPYCFFNKIPLIYNYDVDYENEYDIKYPSVINIINYIFYFIFNPNNENNNSEQALSISKIIYDEYNNKGFISALNLFNNEFSSYENVFDKIFKSIDKNYTTYYEGTSDIETFYDDRAIKCYIIILAYKSFINHNKDYNYIFDSTGSDIEDGQASIRNLKPNKDEWFYIDYNTNKKINIDPDWHKELISFIPYFYYNILTIDEYKDIIDSYMFTKDNPSFIDNNDYKYEIYRFNWRDFLLYYLNSSNYGVIDNEEEKDQNIKDVLVDQIYGNDSFTKSNIEIVTNRIKNDLFYIKDYCKLAIKAKIPEGYIGYFISYEKFEGSCIPVKTKNEGAATEIEDIKSYFHSELVDLENTYPIFDTFKDENNIKYNIYNTEAIVGGSAGAVNRTSHFRCNVNKKIDTDLNGYLLNDNYTDLYINKSKELIPLSKIIYIEELVYIYKGNYNGVKTVLDEYTVPCDFQFDTTKNKFLTTIGSKYYDTSGKIKELNDIGGIVHVDVCYIKHISSKYTINSPKTVVKYNNPTSSLEDDYGSTVLVSYIDIPLIKDLFNFNTATIDEFYPKTLTNYRDDLEYITEFNKTIRYSDVIQSESRQLSWRNFNAEHYKNINENKGNITNIVGAGNQILVHTEHSLFVFINNDSIEANNNSIKLSNTDITDINYKEILTSNLGYGGLKEHNGWVLGSFGYIYYCSDNKYIYRYDNSKLQIINNDIKLYFNNYDIKDVLFLDDIAHNRILMKFTINDNVIHLSYNYLTNYFMSTHDYIHNIGYTTKNNLYLLGKYLCNFDEKNRCKITVPINYSIINYNVKSTIGIIINNDYESIKYLEYIKYKLYLNDSIKSSNDFSDVDNRLIYFSGDVLQIFNELCNTGEININVTYSENSEVELNSDNYKVLPNNKIIKYNDDNTINEEFKKPYWEVGNWNFNHIFDKITNSRLHGNWFIVKFTINNINNRLFEFDTIDCKTINK